MQLCMQSSGFHLGMLTAVNREVLVLHAWAQQGDFGHHALALHCMYGRLLHEKHLCVSADESTKSHNIANALCVMVLVLRVHSFGVHCKVYPSR